MTQGPADLDAAGAAADARIAGTPPAAPGADDDLDDDRAPRQPTAGGGGQAPPPPPPPPAAPPAGDQGDMLYRDAAALRQEMAQNRERYQPFADAFGELDDETRQEVLGVAPHLGGDLAVIGQAFAGLHPGDRRTLSNIIGLIPQDPVRAAELLAQAATDIRGGPPGAGDGSVYDELYDDEEDDELDQPLTMRQWLELDQERDDARRKAQAWDDIVAEAKALGYDANSTDPNEQAKFDSLIAVARRTSDGDLGKAHETLQGVVQQAIDDYSAGKRADAQRPAPTAGGTTVSGERVLESLDDAEAAARQRVDEALGPRQR